MLLLYVFVVFVIVVFVVFVVVAADTCALLGRYYAAQLGIKLRQSQPQDQQAKKYLMTLLDQIESDKRKLGVFACMFLLVACFC